MIFEKNTYPAFIKQNQKGYGVHFPTLFPDHDSEFYRSFGPTKEEAMLNAEKALAYFLAGILYDNEELPSQRAIPAELVTDEMELIWISAAYSEYAEEIQEHLLGRHWHIEFNRDEESEYKAVAYKNNRGQWEVRADGNLPIEKKTEKLLQICPAYPLICLAQRRKEAEDSFDAFVREAEEILHN